MPRTMLARNKARTENKKAAKVRPRKKRERLPSSIKCFKEALEQKIEPIEKRVRQWLHCSQTSRIRVH
jgi:hypothetical protein